MHRAFFTHKDFKLRRKTVKLRVEIRALREGGDELW